MKEQVNIKACLKPSPNVLVSCRGVDGENNALAVAYCCNCSYDPFVGRIEYVHADSQLVKEGDIDFSLIDFL